MSSFVSLSKSKFLEIGEGKRVANRDGVPTELPLRTLVDIDACQSRVELARKVDVLLRIRRRRSDFFPASLSPDPAWDMLLVLAQTELQFGRLNTTDLCDAAYVPMTVASRWLDHLAEAGWVERHSDASDSASRCVLLSPQASSRLRAYLEGLPVALAITDPDEPGTSQESS